MSEQNSKQRSLEQYAKVGDAYVRSVSHAQGIDLDLLLDIAKPEKHWIVLDVATGGGHTALTFAPYVKKVIAVDLTPNMLRTAKRFICEEKQIDNVAFELADAENLPFESGCFDLVTCRIAPHHFPDCQKFVNECSRVLKKDGILLVQDHVLPEEKLTANYVDKFEILRDPSHNQAYSEREWCSMFEKGGLAIERTEQIVKRHDFIKWAKRMNNSNETLQKLILMVKTAPEKVIEWVQPLPSAAEFDSPEASFVNHHIIIAGRK